MSNRKSEFLPGNVTVVEHYDTDTDTPKTDAENKVDAFESALREDSEAFLNVTRQANGGNAPQEFVGRYPADKYDFGQLQVHLQREYGAGDYRVMLYAKGKVRANKLLSIAKPVQVIGDNNATQTDQLSLVLREFQKMQSQMMEIVRSQNGQQNSRKEMLEEMLMYKQLFGNDNRGSQGGIRDIIDTVNGLKDLGINIGGEKDDDGFGPLLEKATPLIQAALGASQQAQQMPQPNPIQPQAQNNMNFLIKSGVKTLINAASKNSDPSTYAAMIVDQFAPQQIQNFFGRPDSFSFLQSIDPSVVPHKLWFEDLAEHVKACMGWPSKYTDLYDDPESDNLAQTPDGAPIDGTD